MQLALRTNNYPNHDAAYYKEKVEMLCIILLLVQRVNTTAFIKNCW